MQNEIKAPQKLLDESGRLANPGWARKLYFQYNPENLALPRKAAKEWDYYFVGNGERGVALTVNDFGPFGMMTASLLKFKENFNLTRSTVTPECLHQPYDDEGTCYMRTADSEAVFIRKPGRHILKLDMADFDGAGNALHVDLVLTVPETDRMVIATPFAEDEHFFYLNEKINCLRAAGTVTLGGDVYTFSPERDFGVLDFGRGVWPAHNRWYWGSASGELDGHDFGFNIGCGFGDLSHATENMIFYDGAAHKFDRIDSFGIPEKGFTYAPWHIASNDGRFDMVFTPIMDRASICDITKRGSLQHQVFGTYTGKAVLDDGTVLEIRDFFGFAEDVINNWSA